jgi:hypothetical protein
VVLFRVHGIGTDDVGAQFLEVGDITLAVRVIGQRVAVVLVFSGRPIGAVFLLVGDTADKELGAVVGVKEFVALRD